MGNGVLPDVSGTALCKLSNKHILIQMPGEKIKRKVISKDSLLYVAYSLNKEYVHLPGIHEGAVKVTGLSNDILRSKVLLYKVETYKTFTAIIAGAGYLIWTNGEDKK